MKNNLYLLWILGKRLVRSPGFLCALLWLPVCLLILHSVEKKSGLETEAAVFASGDAFALDMKENLLQYQGFIQFRAYGSPEEVKERVASGKAECGYILGAGIQEGLKSGNIQDLVLVYRSPDSKMAGIINEIVFAKILGTFSPEFYLDYVETALQKDGFDQAYIREKAKVYYQKYLNNGSTFHFEFYGGEKMVHEQSNIHVIPIRGLIAAMIFLSGLCGLGDWKDCKNSNRFLFTRKLWVVKICSLFIPMFLAAVMGSFCLFLTKSEGNIYIELRSMAIYLLSLEAFFLVADCIIQTEAAVRAIFPFASLISILIPPVFFDFSLFCPPVKWIQMLIPVSWYLELFSRSV